MQKSTLQHKYGVFEQSKNFKNVISLLFIVFHLMLFTFYDGPQVFGQNQQQQQQNSVSKDDLICQLIKDNKSSVGINFQQALNICNHQNSIGSSQALAELCYISSDKGIDEINTICDGDSPNQLSSSVNEGSDPSSSQGTTNNPESFTLFDGVSKFFTDLINP